MEHISSVSLESISEKYGCNLRKNNAQNHWHQRIKLLSGITSIVQEHREHHGEDRGSGADNLMKLREYELAGFQRQWMFSAYRYSHKM